MVNRPDVDLLELAVEHQFLNQDSADRLKSEARKLSLPPEMLALKAGVLAPWQIQALKMLGKPEDIVPGYRVNGLLGRGGFGSVFRATQLNMSREVALKTIPMSTVRDSSAARRFEREAKIIGQLRHPHIVAAYDFGMHEEHLFLSLELVDGKDLSTVLRRVKKFDEVTTWHIIRQTVTALAYAAELDVTHRDIKPGNLLVTKPPLGYKLPPQVPFVKVSDFGLACFTETRVEEGITMEDSGLGTPSYVAPEQLQGGGVDERADIYSLGATAFHLLKGIAPYANLAPMAVAKEKLSGEENWIEQLGTDSSNESWELIQRMSAYEVSDRVKNHAELLNAIDQLLESIGGDLNNSTQVFELPDAETPRISLNETASGIFVTDQETMGSSDLNSDFVLNSDVSKTGVARSDKLSKAKVSLGWLKMLGGAIVIVLSVAAFLHVFFRSADVGTFQSRSQFQPDYSAVVRSFDGREIVLANFKKSTGSWSIEEDDEGGKVLAGSNCRVILPCDSSDGQPMEALRCSIGLRLLESSHVTITAVADDSQESGFVVDVDGDGIQILAEDSATGDALSERLPWKIAPGESSGYVRILIDRYPDSWVVYRDSTVVGQVPNGNLDPVDLAISVDGKALFESPEIMPLFSSALPTDPSTQ